MTADLVNSCDIYGPIEQATRCLDRWLTEENRFMPLRHKERVAALMARYFHVEDAVTDDLMLSFLRHYSGLREIDIEDPQSVRLEIKALLDQSQVQVPGAGISGYVFITRALMAFAGGVLITVLLVLSWQLENKKITDAQKATLQDKVREIVRLHPDIHPATVWADVKRPMKVARVEDISYWDFDESLEILEKWPASTP